MSHVSRANVSKSGLIVHIVRRHHTHRGALLRTNIVLDDELINKARKLMSLPTKKAVVDEAPSTRRESDDIVPAVVDTTVWIDFFRNAKTEQTDLLELVIRRGEAALGDLILSEILQGIDSDREFRALKRHYSDSPIYSMIGRENAVPSAVNYRKLRAKGITVRKIVDCWI